MQALDPEDDAPSPAGPQDSQSSDQSKSGLRAAWDAWTSRPENNAALLQTGLALLQPRSPGQSAVGQFANAIGQGAEASDRNIAGQQAEAKAQSEQEYKRREADARETTAGAYADQVKQGGAKSGGAGLKSALMTQKAFQDWLRKGEDPYALQINNGMSNDPIVQALSKQFPDIKTKGDIIANPAATRAALAVYKKQFAEPSEDDEETTPSTTAQPPRPASSARAPQARIIYDKQGKAYQWDGVQGHPPVPM